MRIGGYFITGTDTGVGKTWVTGLWAERLRAAGVRVLAAKPAESGAGDDAERLGRAAGHPPVCLYRFADPLAPGVAAAAAGIEIVFDDIAHEIAVRARELSAQLVLVEGAGGLLCPFGGDRTAADLAAHLDLPLVIVARSGVGTINHSLLTLHEAKRRNLRVAGLVLSEVDVTRGKDEATNAYEITRRFDVRILGTVRHGESTERLPSALLELAQANPAR